MFIEWRKRRKGENKVDDFIEFVCVLFFSKKWEAGPTGSRGGERERVEGGESPKQLEDEREVKYNRNKTENDNKETQIERGVGERRGSRSRE